MKRAGIDALGMHLEAVTERVRARIMPGKAQVSVRALFHGVRGRRRRCSGAARSPPTSSPGSATARRRSWRSANVSSASASFAGLGAARSSAEESAAGNASDVSEGAAQQARRFRVQRRNPGSGFKHQNAAGQAFENSAQAFADAVVFFQTGGQVAISDFEFLAEMSHLPLQLSVGWPPANLPPQ